MLFADCRGFTTLMHERGPAAVRPIVDEFFRRSAEIIVRHDGIVDHFLGDAVLAFFNVPIQHEDHVARAVSAAMEMQQAVPIINAKLGQGDLLKVGMGITTGIAFTGVVGSSDCKDYTALGDTVNIAARLQGEAAAGEILVNEPVYAQIRGQYPDAVVREAVLKGILEPVRAYVLV